MASKRNKQTRCFIGDVVFWIGFAMCCLLLVPVFALLICVYGIFTLADSCSRWMKREKREQALPEGKNEGW